MGLYGPGLCVMERDGMGRDRIEWDGNGWYGMVCDGIEWDWMGLDGMVRDGIGWDGM